MLEYLISLLDDANDFSWDVAKASHAVLLCRMEQGEVVTYQEIEKKLTALGGLIVRDILHKVSTVLRICIILEKVQTNLPSPCLASTTIKVLVSTRNHMILKVLYTSTFVLLALPQMVGPTHILKKIVGTSLGRVQKQVGLSMCPVTHAQAVHTDCVSSRVFYNKKIQEKQKYLRQKVPKSIAISWFHKNKAFQHIVPNLSYAQVLIKGSNPTSTVPLDKPFQHMVPPLYQSKASVRGLNPNFRSPCKSSGVWICLFGVLRRFQHCTGHITTGSWKGRGNQYI